MSSISKHKKSELIHTKLSLILMRESSNPEFEQVTISKVLVSSDTSTAKVYFSTYQTDKNIEELTHSLNLAAGFFQKKLAHSLKTRNTPRLLFVYDAGFDHANEIDSLLR